MARLTAAIRVTRDHLGETLTRRRRRATARTRLARNSIRRSETARELLVQCFQWGIILGWALTVGTGVRLFVWSAGQF